jgi:hypothetical protein
MMDAALQHVPAATGPVLQQPLDLPHISVPREHQNGEARMLCRRRAASSIPSDGVAAEHPGSSDNDPGTFAHDRKLERGQVRAHRDDLEAMVTAEHVHETLANQIRVLSDQNRDRAIRDREFLRDPA